mmetsp:Transcript_54393/g.100486  ORF Transcript_54393/g.100486 Transcript_54393/m.100486 type:complete len:469 (-) Transcript_54393:40-1446(-)
MVRFGRGGARQWNGADEGRGPLAVDKTLLPSLVAADLRPVLQDVRDTGQVFWTPSSSSGAGKTMRPSKQSPRGHILDEWTQSTLEALIKLSGGQPAVAPKLPTREEAEISHRAAAGSDRQAFSEGRPASPIKLEHHDVQPSPAVSSVDGWHTSQEVRPAVSSLTPHEQMGTTLEELHAMGIPACVEPGAEWLVDSDPEILKLLEHVKELELRVATATADCEKKGEEVHSLEASSQQQRERTSTLRQAVKESSMRSSGTKVLLEESRLRQQLDDDTFELHALQAENQVLKQELAKIQCSRDLLDGEIASLRAAVFVKQQEVSAKRKSLTERYIDNELLRAAIEKLEAEKACAVSSGAGSDVLTVEDLSEIATSSAGGEAGPHHEVLHGILNRACSDGNMLATPVQELEAGSSSEAAASPFPPTGANTGRPQRFGPRRNIEARVQPGEAYLPSDSEEDSRLSSRLSERPL